MVSDLQLPQSLFSCNIRNMSISSYIKKHSFIASTTIIVLIILAIIVGRNSGKGAVVATNSSVKKVTLVDVSTFRLGNDIVSANGIVESRGQADLKSQASAPVAVIHGSIGDTVYAGQVIIELQNNDVQAQLEQARASLAMAEGQYLTGGVSLDSARSGAVDKVRDAYLKGYEAVSTQIDPLLNNNDGAGGHLSSLITDTKLNNDIASTRTDLATILHDWKVTADALSASSDAATLTAAIKLSEKNLVIIDGLLSNVSQVLNNASRGATPTFSVFLNTWKVVVSGARASVSGANQALTGAEATLSGASSSYGSTAEAQVAIAKAGVNNLEAQLAKTIIKSPISGKIAALPLEVGELATPGQLLATVIGDSGLDIKAYASGEDLNRIKVGAPVTIENNVKGTVESVAPSVSNTNRKVEVVISVTDQANSKLVIGENVQVTIKVAKDSGTQSSSIVTGSVSAAANSNAVYILPIQDVKIVPGEAFVFTVDGDSKVKKNSVTLGEVKGDFIEVKGGITSDMKIVSPVYELDEGESVVTE
jgi:multidrug efflux pump subunit AcrA (membrane-fusion protein)